MEIPNLDKNYCDEDLNRFNDQLVKKFNYFRNLYKNTKFENFTKLDKDEFFVNNEIEIENFFNGLKFIKKTPESKVLILLNKPLE